MRQYLPNGMLGLALAGLLAAFMAGVAANVALQHGLHLRPARAVRPSRTATTRYYLRFGRIATVIGVAHLIATALIASGYTNIMNYIQVLFSVFNVPLFATFIIGMFWKRMTPCGGVVGDGGRQHRRARHLPALQGGLLAFATDLDEAFWAAIVAFFLDAVVTLGVTFVTEPRPVEELAGPRLRHGEDGRKGQGRHGLVPLARHPRLIVLAMTAAISVLLI